MFSSNYFCCRFRAVEAGRAGLLALDTTNKLWIRRGLSPQYPEGVSWAPVRGQVPTHAISL